MPRPFASGSRQAPDPYDQFLEQNGFYRKHTARDSSCLFRTISEQLYDTQLHHLTIRQRCVDFMRKHKHRFQKSIEKDIDEYLDEMCKPKTYGTLLELRALAYLYRRNVILFEAYNTGTFMIKENGYKNVFRIFFTPEKHFDTVFTSSFIEAAAFCQGICYEILYRRVFKLPDVMYAVEQMLHGNSLEFVKSKTHYVGPYARKIVYTDGREFELNGPDETNCILDNRVLCHFHNPNFPQFADTLHQDMHMIEVAQYDNQRITKTLDSLLPEKYISCVQQLLKDGITPFPYKVAKALDPDIYRNIEFDAWSEMRKEQRFKNWYTGGNNLQIGVKCLVKLGSSQSNLYNCHIQDMSPEKGPCLVYIEELAQKHTVPYESLQPLPSELAKPWPLPFRYQKRIDRSPERITISDSKKCRKMNGKSRYRNMITEIKKEIYTDDEIMSEKGDVAYQLKQFTSIQHYYPPSYEVLAMPFSVENSNNDNIRQSRRNSVNSAATHLTTGTDIVKQETKKEDDNDLDYASTDNFPSYGYEGYPEPFYHYSYDSGIMPSNLHNPFYCMYNGQPYPAAPGGLVPHGVYVQPTMSGSQPVPNAFYPSVAGAIPPPPALLPASSSGQSQGVTPSVPGRVNFSANRSMIPTGEDLPSDVSTLRFFYNLGYEYYKHMQKSASEVGTSSDKNDAVSKLANDLQSNLKLDKDNSGTSSMKPNGHQSNGHQSNGHYGNRKFPSRYFNNKRNDKHINRSLGGGNNGNRSHSEVNTKMFHPPVIKNSSSVHCASTSITTANNKVSVSNAATNNSSEQAIQASPAAITLMSADGWNNDAMNNSPLYNAQAGPMPYNGPCIPVFSEGEAQQGMYVPPATVMTIPYGMYPMPQPPHQGAPFQAYLPPPNVSPMGVPPPPPPAAAFSNNPFINPAAGNEQAPIIMNSDTVDGASYTIMSYPPYFYSPTNNGNGMPTNGTPVQPTYWYPAAPPYPTSIATTASANNTSVTSATSIASR